jgi:hypothetical protein
MSTSTRSSDASTSALSTRSTLTASAGAAGAAAAGRARPGPGAGNRCALEPSRADALDATPGTRASGEDAAKTARRERPARARGYGLLPALTRLTALPTARRELAELGRQTASTRRLARLARRPLPDGRARRAALPRLPASLAPLPRPLGPSAPRPVQKSEPGWATRRARKFTIWPTQPSRLS